MTFTKGEWKIVSHGMDSEITAQDGKVICEMSNIPGDNQFERRANLDLIKAAPDMYEACKEALLALESPEARKVLAFTFQRESLKKALAKAEGK